MKKVIFIGFLLSTLTNCINKKDKSELFYKDSIGNGIFMECYKVYSGGATTTNIYSNYVSDLKNFRIYIGEYNDEFGYDCKVSGDTIIVNQIANVHTNHIRITKTSKYSISKLVKEHLFE